jgi:thioredoxin reductase
VIFLKNIEKKALIIGAGPAGLTNIGYDKEF